MIRSTLALAAVMLGVAAPVASARPHQHGFGRAHPHAYRHTFPVASSLCARVAAGHTPKRLAGDTAQIEAACSTLSASYQAALSTYKSAVAPIAAEVKSTLASLQAARQTAKQTGDWSAYKAAVKQAASTLKSLRAEVRAAQKAYVTAIRSARKTFWTTIHALPGGSSLGGDSGNPTPPPGPTVPPII